MQMLNPLLAFLFWFGRKITFEFFLSNTHERILLLNLIHSDYKSDPLIRDPQCEVQLFLNKYP